MIKRPLCLIGVCFLAAQAWRVISGQVPSVQEQMEPALRAAAEREESVSVSGFVFRMEEKTRTTELWLEDTKVTVSGREIPEKKVVVWLRDRTEEDDWDPRSSSQSDKDRRQRNSGEGLSASEIRIGNQVCVFGRAGIFESPRNPGEFDRQSYYGHQGAGMCLYADRVEIVSAKRDALKDTLSRIRAAWRDRLIRHLGPYYGGTVSSILLGDKSGLDPEMKTMYQKNGIGHLLAISGLHMSFIGMGVCRLLRKMGCPLVVADAVGGIVLILYTMMIGAGVSSLRALIMFLIRIGADITGRDYDLPTALAVSAAILCAVQPFYLTDAGFLLSFGAILGLILLIPVYGALGRNRIWTGLSASMAVNTMLLGPILYFYYEVPPYSLFLNLLVIPALPVIMGAGIAGSLLSLVWDPLGGWTLQIAGLVLRGYDMLCGAVQRLPYSRIVTGRPDGTLLVGYYLCVLSLCLVHLYLAKRESEAEERSAGRGGAPVQTKGGWRGRCRQIPGVLLMALFCGTVPVCRSSHHTEGEMQVTMLDVGQGDGIVVRGPYGGTYMIDGGSSDVNSVGTYRIEPFLLSEGMDCVDYVFLSHGDGDHISGVEELLGRQELGVRIRTVVLPPEQYLDDNLLRIAELARENGTKVAVMGAGQRVRESSGEDGEREMTFTCLGPDSSGLGAEGNASSMVLSLCWGGFDLLFTGDLEGEGEAALVREGLLPQCDVLKVAHHGSKNSTGEEFLLAVRPVVGLISAGRDNRYGHPHEETVQRLEEIGCRVYSTQQNGAITIESDGETFRMQPAVSD